MFKLNLYLSVKSLKSEFCHFSYCVGQPKVSLNFYKVLTQCASKKDHLRNMKIVNFQNLFRDAWGCW